MEELALSLVELYAEVGDRGILPQTSREAVIILLLMPDKPPLECTAYRPQSMLNLDFKILSKLLATRLLPHMTSLVYRGQVGFIPSRNTTLNIWCLLGILELTKEEDPDEVIFTIDIEEAFDSLEWEFLCAVLAKMGTRIYKVGSAAI